MGDATFSKIDGVNWVERTIPTGSGPLTVQGLSVRAIRKALEGASDDDLVLYMFEQTPEALAVPLVIGPIAGIGPSPDTGTVFLFGPEGIRGLKNAGMVK